MLNFSQGSQTSPNLTPQGETNESKESVRDLGIIFQINGKFDKHISNIVSQGNRMAGNP